MRRTICFGSVPAIISGHQYAGDGWAENIQTLCTEGRIDGAERLGHQWVIPINAEKPKDARIKSGRYIKTKSGNGENEDGKKTV